MNVNFHDSPAAIHWNHFLFKSLSSWSLNLYMGCGHGCLFCFEGLLEVFQEVKKVNRHTVFMEPINIRLGVAARIQAEAEKLGKKINMDPYTNDQAWVAYALEALRNAERAAEEVGIRERLHLWPDHVALGKKSVVNSQEDPVAYGQWLEIWWNRVSEWPGK